MREPRGQECECTECGKLFGGEHTFDRHREGPYVPSGQRRCRTGEELLAIGLVEKDGVWIRPLKGVIDSRGED